MDLTGELWAVKVEGPNQADWYQAMACKEDAFRRAADLNSMLQYVDDTRHASVARWPDSPEEFAQSLKDGDPDWD